MKETGVKNKLARVAERRKTIRDDD